MKLLVARSTSAIQNMLWIAIYVYVFQKKKNHNFEIYLISFSSSTDPSIFMTARQQMMWILTHVQKLDRMRLCFRMKVRFLTLYLCQIE